MIIIFLKHERIEVWIHFFFCPKEFRSWSSLSNFRSCPGSFRYRSFKILPRSIQIQVFHNSGSALAPFFNKNFCFFFFQIANYYVISGFCSHTFSLAIGAGDLLATWMLNGEPGRNVSSIDVARFLPLHKNRRYLRDRVPEIVGMTYKLNPPLQVCRTARNIRRSPVHDDLKQQGAVFGEIMGYERPLYFDKSGLTLSTDLKIERSFFFNLISWFFFLFSGARNAESHKPAWFNAVSAEYESCRKEVGLLDMSNFSKFEVTVKIFCSFIKIFNFLKSTVLWNLKNTADCGPETKNSVQNFEIFMKLN